MTSDPARSADDVRETNPYDDPDDPDDPQPVMFDENEAFTAEGLAWVKRQAHRRMKLMGLFDGDDAFDGAAPLKRFVRWKHSEITRPWMPRIFRGGDEFCNPSLAFVVPPFGCFIVFYGRTLKTELCPEHNDGPKRADPLEGSSK